MVIRRTRLVSRIYSCAVATVYTTLCLLAHSVLLSMAAPPDYADFEYEAPTYFIPQPNNVSYQAGQTATLRCSIENLGKKWVVWRKASNPHPISIGDLIYTEDSKYEVRITPERREYNLLIKNVQPSDGGVYECQVSSKDKIFRHILLRVTGRPDNLPSESQMSDTGHIQNPPYVSPEIFLSGRMYVNSGETIQLVCNVTGNTEVPQDVDWFKNGHSLRPTVSKKLFIRKETSIAEKKLYSVLEIRDSKLEDSGEYTCRNSEDLIASQKVIVLSEEKRSNTDKRGAAGEAKSGQMCNRQWGTMFLAVLLSAILSDILNDVR